MTLEDSVPNSSHFDFSAESQKKEALHVEKITNHRPAAVAKKSKIADKVAEKNAKRVKKNAQNMNEVTEFN